MAHFAQIDDDNVVTQVIVVNNQELLDNGVESEAKGVAFCQSLLGGNWVQTSYNGTIRKRFAGVGCRYDAGRDAFIWPCPFPSWTLDDATCAYVAPVPYPADGKPYRWDEPSLAWVEVAAPQ